MGLSVSNAIKCLPGNSRAELSSWDTTKADGGRGEGKGYPAKRVPKGKTNFTGGKGPKAHLFTPDRPGFLSEACLLYWQVGAQESLWLSWQSTRCHSQQTPDTELIDTFGGKEEKKIPHTYQDCWCRRMKVLWSDKERWLQLFDICIQSEPYSSLIALKVKSTKTPDHVGQVLGDASCTTKWRKGWWSKGSPRKSTFNNWLCPRFLWAALPGQLTSPCKCSYPHLAHEITEAKLTWPRLQWCPNPRSLCCAARLLRGRWC